MFQCANPGVMADRHTTMCLKPSCSAQTCSSVPQASGVVVDRYDGDGQTHSKVLEPLVW